MRQRQVYLWVCALRHAWAILVYKPSFKLAKATPWVIRPILKKKKKTKPGETAHVYDLARGEGEAELSSSRPAWTTGLQKAGRDGGGDWLKLARYGIVQGQSTWWACRKPWVGFQDLRQTRQFQHCSRSYTPRTSTMLNVGRNIKLLPRKDSRWILHPFLGSSAPGWDQGYGLLAKEREFWDDGTRDSDRELSKDYKTFIYLTFASWPHHWFPFWRSKVPLHTVQPHTYLVFSLQQTIKSQLVNRRLTPKGFHPYIPQRTSA